MAQDGMSALGDAIASGQLDFTECRDMLYAAHLRMFGTPGEWEGCLALKDSVTRQLADAVAGRNGVDEDEPLLTRLAWGMAQDRLSWTIATRVATDLVMDRISEASFEDQEKEMYWDEEKGSWIYAIDLDTERELYRQSVETAIGYRLDVLTARIERDIDR